MKNKTQSIIENLFEKDLDNSEKEDENNNHRMKDYEDFDNEQLDLEGLGIESLESSNPLDVFLFHLIFR